MSITVRPTSHSRKFNTNRKVLQAALALYGREGWSGFNLTKVAKEAGVGKSSIYSRWPNRDVMFMDAVITLIPFLSVKGETLRDILHAEIEYRIKLYLGPYCESIRQIFVEGKTVDEPTLHQVHDRIFSIPISNLKDKLWTYKASHQLPDSVSVTRLVDAIEGSVLMRTLLLPPENVPCFLTEIYEYADSLIADQLLRAQIPDSLQPNHLSCYCL